MLTLTEKAVAEVKRIMADQGLQEGSFLRLGVSGGGCSGLSYVMTFDQQPKEGDRVAEFAGLKVALDADAEPYMADTVLDFNDSITKRGFVFNNPNAAGTCGCGSSFSV